MARKGRPKKPKIKTDEGTEQLRNHKALLLGKPRKGEKINPALAEYPLGVLLARNLINTDQEEAGTKYAVLYAKSIRMMRQLGFDPGRFILLEDDEARIEKKYMECRKRLRRCGVHVQHLVENIAVYRVLPSWVLLGKKALQHADLKRLRDGLDRLADLLVRKGSSTPPWRQHNRADDWLDRAPRRPQS